MSELRASVRSAWHSAGAVATAALIAGCALVSGVVVDRDEGAPAPATVSAPPDRAPLQRARVAAPRLDVASWYGAWHQGRPTASGEAFDMAGLTAAHPSLPLGSCLEVLHLANGRRVFVRVNDRGPYIEGRTIDLSYRAAQELLMVDSGLARVRLRTVKRAACEAAE